MKLVTPVLSRTGIVFVLAATFISVHAQTGTAPATRGRTDPVLREQQRKVDMEIIENALNRSPAHRSGRYAPLVLEQIREDFLRIQVIDRKLTHSISSSQLLDLELVAQAAADIKKRAQRLKKNLALPEVNVAPGQKQNAEEPPAPERVRSSLVILSNLIDRFVSNPIFKESKLIDAKLSAQALEDIERIVAISSEVKKTSEKLRLGMRTK